MGGKSGGNPIVGYKYYAGVQAVGALGPVDALLKIKIGDRVAWSGRVTASQQIYIDKPELFGGLDREGGVQGSVDIMFGDETQAQNGYLKNNALSDAAYNENPTFWQPTLGQVPSFRGVFGLLFKSFYWIAFNPYFKPLAYQLERVKQGWGNQGAWYPTKADIVVDGYHTMNAAHMIFQTITDSEWGMGYPRGQVDQDRFKAAADTLYTEGMGLCLRWDRQTSAGDFIDHICKHINGSLVVDLRTGLYKLKLARDDYTAANLPLFDQSNVVALESYERRGWGETVNEVTVEYTDVVDGETKPVTVQDLGNIQIQNGVVTQTKRLEGIPTAALAQRVAARELRTLAAPLSSINITTNRAAVDLEVGDAFRFTWPDLGLEDVVYRIASVDLGQINKGRIRIGAVEDIFGLPDSTYTGVPPTGWAPPDGSAKAIDVSAIQESPYYVVRRSTPDAVFTGIDPDAGFAMTYARKPTGLSTNYGLFWWGYPHGDSNLNKKYLPAQGGAAFTPTATLTQSVGQMDTALHFIDPAGAAQFAGSYWCQVDAEIMIVKAVDLNANTVTVDRGTMDTVPAEHAANAVIWFPYQAKFGHDTDEHVDSETVQYGLFTHTTQDSWPIGPTAAATETITFDSRMARPYPPGNFKVNTEYFPGFIQGELALTWAHRDRVQQTAGLIPFTQGNIGPEAGTTYKLTFHDAATSTLLRTETGVSAASYTYTQEAADYGHTPAVNTNLLQVELASQRSTLASWQQHDITIRRVGYGYSYGYRYGGL